MDAQVLDGLTLCVPYYRQPQMLARQLAEWCLYPHAVRIVVIDDGSPEPALHVLRTIPPMLSRIQLYRVLEDIKWNRNGARNLAAHVATTDWLLMTDIDHVLPADAAFALLNETVDPSRWYRFPRWRCGRADETRRKDEIPDDCEFGQIHPHMDSYLATRSLYWSIGGTDEDYSGVLGGGSPFLRLIEHAAGPPVLMPANIPLHVYTRSKIADSSEWSLSRDTKPGKDITRRKRASGDVRPKNPIRFEWERVL